MIKVIPPGAWDFDGPQLGVVKVAGAGFFGDDFKDFVKRAGHPLASWVRANRPAPGEEWVHSHAFGVHERFGGNRNGDSYGEKMAIADHPTFEKFARWYYNHANNDPKKSYGVVKKAWYNPEVGRVEVITALNATKEAADRNGGLVAEKTLNKLASGQDVAVSQSCFPPGELVLLADGRHVPIETVGHGDVVVTHLGNAKPVGHTIRLDYDGEVVTFKASGVPGEVTATADHKIWVRPRYDPTAPCPACGKNFKQLKCHLREQADDPKHRAIGDLGRAGEGWRRADEVHPGDYVRTPFNTGIGQDRGDPEYAVLLGYYASEGSVYEYHRGKPDADWRQGVDFTFGRTEIRYADRVVGRVRRYGGVTVTAGVPKLRPGCYHVRVSGAALRERIEADAGRYSYAKEFSSTVMGWAPENQLLLVGAFFDGDGTWHKTNERLVATTVSEVLATQLVVMCWRNNIPATLNRLWPPAHQKAGKRPYYTVEVSGRYATLIPTDKVPRGYKFSNTCAKSIGHLKHQTAGRVTVRKAPLPLTYVDGGYAYHRVMKVTTKHYTGPVYNFGVADDESYVVRFVAVKNCRVPYDVCTACGNEAKSRAQYCTGGRCKYGGCRDNLGRVFDDGFHLTVDNPKCTFFDLSDVSDTRGADRTAFVTGKVASSRLPGGAELAERLGLVAPEYLLDPRTVSAASCLRKLAALSKSYPDVPGTPDWDDLVGVRTKLAGDKPAPVPSFSGDDLQRHQLLRDLAADGVVLPPAVWLHAAVGGSPEKCAAVFGGGLDPRRDLLDRADLHDLLAESLAGEGARLSPAGRYAWLSPKAAAHAREAQLGVLRGPVKRAHVEVPEAVRKEAKARYLAYQACVLALHEHSPAFDVLAAECVRHGRGV